MPDPVSVWVRKDLAPTAPQTHALVIGCSNYSHLPPAPPRRLDPDSLTFNLGQLRSPATSAWLFAKWLRDQYRPLTAKLGSVRLLLSPSEAEVSRLTDLPAVPKANRRTVLQALQDWYTDCSQSTGNVAIMYVSGHGVQMSKNDGGILLLEDFAEFPRTPLEGSLNVPAVRAGMYGKQMARVQYYLLDACQATPPATMAFDRLGEGASLGSPREGELDSSVVITSAAPGSTAFGAPGVGTVFSEALRECLDGWIAERIPGTDQWGVSTAALLKSVPKRIRHHAERRGLRQNGTVGGQLGDHFIHELAAPPLVPFTLEVLPEAGARHAFAKLVDARQKLIFEKRPVAPGPVSETLPAGYYTVSVSVDPPTPPFDGFSQSFDVQPPTAPVSVRFE